MEGVHVPGIPAADRPQEAAIRAPAARPLQTPARQRVDPDWEHPGMLTLSLREIHAPRVTNTCKLCGIVQGSGDGPTYFSTVLQCM